ncbi:ABC transporter permease [Thermostaphylospora chromogena]|uniref:ABC-2 type transport system permease protein n=1 Tax=Thermostaphylospora chromogena TaxID=35622 RepID=A0A1H1F0P0_9ACTN|nr:ABC transporter permease [Thermostaphylospora chromogena]SDQ94537.1 ABC-2 type transport system permease protein [Thermostaphylospora chromogena]
MKTDLLHSIRLARLSLTQLGRNQTALFTVVLMPFLLVVMYIGLGRDRAMDISGVPATLFVLTGMPGMLLGFAVFINLVNSLTARREELLLKRLRSKVSPVGILGGTALGALIVFLGQIAFLVVWTVQGEDGPLPANLPLWLIAAVLGTAVFALLAIAYTGITPNTELAQITVLPPLLIIMMATPFYVPTSAMPPVLATVSKVMPTTPVVEIMRTAYLGRDFVGGEGEPLGFAEQWVAALPSFGVLLAWGVVAVLLAHRLFRWEPRRG